MENTFSLSVQHIDDLPILWAVIQEMGLSSILDKHLVMHGNSKANNPLTIGESIAIWLLYILSCGDHRKSVVESWVDSHSGILSRLLGKMVSGVAFSDDRLGTILSHLQDKTAWEAIEADIYERELSVYILDKPVFLDSTTSCGYHSANPDGLMQLGHSKDHRSDLAQIKLMGAVADELLIATTVVAGNAADPPLYIPMLSRLHRMLGAGRLYVGDCKMSSMATRAWCAAHDDLYLTHLEKKCEAASQFEQWIDKATSPETDLPSLELVVRDGAILGGGYEFSRDREAIVDGSWVQWKERVLVVRSTWLTDRLWARLQSDMERAEKAIAALTPPVKPGKRQLRDAESIQEAVNNTLDKYGVSGLIKVNWTAEEYQGKSRKKFVRYVITEVMRDEAALAELHNRLGWRAIVTNAPVERLSFSDASVLRREGWEIERQFYTLKNKPLGIRPLCVRTNEQIVGLTNLLTLGARVLMIFEHRLREGLAAVGEEMEGLYAHDKNKTTGSPTGVRVLEAIARQNITLIEVTISGHCERRLDSVPPWMDKLLQYARLPIDTYSCLLKDTIEQQLVANY